MINPIRRVFIAATICLSSVVIGSCDKKPTHEFRVQATSASVEVLHTPVTVQTALNSPSTPIIGSRVEKEGRVSTGPNGRAIVRTDDGLELRLAGDTEVSFHDGRARLDRGRAFVSSWGDDERSLQIGADLTLAVSDTALEAERTGDAIHVIGVRGEAGWRLQSRQGRLQQGESLQGRGDAIAVRPAGVWDDWTGGAASPHGASNRGALGSGVAVIHLDSGEAPSALAVNEHRVGVSVEGDVAVTTVSQRFFNGADRTAPVEYRIRMPEGAIVSSFLVERNDSVTRAAPGTVATLSRESGRSALLASPEGGLYARLDPIAPGQTIRCELQYVQWLVHDGGRRTYSYPMGDPVAPPFEGEFTFELTATRANVGALRGPVGSTVQGQQLRFARSDFRPRADLFVDLFDEVAPETPSARIWQSQPGDWRDARYVLVDLTVPQPADTGTDLVIVLDDSAAMDRGPLSIAGAAVDAILHQLGPNDRISLMFGDLRARPATGPAGELLAATPARREAILDAIAHTEPGGATDLHRQLSDAYARLDPRRNGAVIYLGDGMPTMGALDPERLVDETLRIAPDIRLYVIALGNDPHPEVLARLAQRSGLVTQAADQSEAVTAAHRVAAHAMRPVLRDVSVDLGTTVAHPLPANIEQWVSGEPLRVMGELSGAPPRSITIAARVGAEIQRWTLPARVDTVHEYGDIRRRWGLARLTNLENGGASRGTLADLGVRFGLITRTSALVLDAPATGGADGNAGLDVAGSLWPTLGTFSRLPRLGIGDEVEPRGVRSIFEEHEYPMVNDDEAGWSRHYLGEGAWNNGMLAYALTAASADADACVERARALRPQLSGNVAINATIAADGRVTAATVGYSTLHDAGAESCIRRAVASLTLPQPSMYGAAPGTVSHTFEYPQAFGSRRGSGCPATSRLPRRARMVLWRERLAANPTNTAQIFTDAMWRCEIRIWEDRAALLDLTVRAATSPNDLGALRNQLTKDARDYLDRAVARRWGPSLMHRAYMAAQGYINWDSLLRRLADPAVTVDRKIELVRAYQVLSPHDIDLQLRLMSLYEQAGRGREARHVGDLLRRDAYADTRVRALVGEMLIRAGQRDEGLRAFSEIAEYAPYDTNARARLGDLLLTYGGTEWAGEAYLQYQTLAALRPGDPVPRVRMALAALVAQRDDEALRILRGVAEDSGGDMTASAVEALFTSEVARIAAEHRDDPAVQGWMRVASLMHIAREGGVVARWTHPDVALELRAQQAGDTAFVTVGDNSSPVHVRVFSPGSALEGSRLLLRASSGLAGARTVTAHVALLRSDERGPRILEREVTLNAGTRVVALMVRGGALVDDTNPIPEIERVPLASETY